MITNNNQLEVFENLQIDYSLPKYKKQELDGTEDSFKNGDEESPRINRSVVFSDQDNIAIEEAESDPRHSWFSFLAFWRPKPPPEPKPRISIEDFFKSVKNSTEEIVVIKERAAGYEKALLNAKRAGQQALVEKLIDGLNAHRMKAQLVALGLSKFVSEENIVRFYKECRKGLRLDYLANFVRTVPQDIVDKKTHADEIGIFDQYVVLHYDPLARSWSETEEERRRRLHPDPILLESSRAEESYTSSEIGSTQSAT